MNCTTPKKTKNIKSTGLVELAIFFKKSSDFVFFNKKFIAEIPRDNATARRSGYWKVNHQLLGMEAAK